MMVLAHCSQTPLQGNTALDVRGPAQPNVQLVKSSFLYLLREKLLNFQAGSGQWSGLDTEEHSPDVDQIVCSAWNVYVELPSGVLLRRIFDSTVIKELAKT